MLPTREEWRIAGQALTSRNEAAEQDAEVMRQRWEGMTDREKRQARVFGAALFVAAIAVVLLDVLTNTRAF